jgi:hypothetical protein
MGTTMTSEQLKAWHDDLISRCGDNILADVLRLHVPTDWRDRFIMECQGEGGGPDYGAEWPCETVGLIAERLDMERTREDV